MTKGKKYVLWLLVLLLAFPTATSYALSFVPRFIQHYHNHYEQNHPLTFIEFIGEHMVSKEQHDKHEKLPDGQETCPFNTVVLTVPLCFDLRSELEIVWLEQTELTHESNSTLTEYQFSFSEYTESIWQPPKIA